MEDSNAKTKQSLRSEELKSYGLLEFRGDLRFQDLLFLASQMFEVPIAAINLIDEQRQHYKFKIGLQEDERALGNSLCEIVLHSQTPLIISDLTRDQQNGSKSLPTFSEPILFYAGFPLVTSKGFVLGTFFIMDVRNRNLSSGQLELLQKLVQQALFHIESLFDVRFIKAKTREAIHDVNNHSAIISGSSYFLKDLAQKTPGTLPQITTNAERIQSAIHKIVQSVKNLRNIIIS